MTENVELKEAIEKAIIKLKEYYGERPESVIQLFHHNDSDGITSATILSLCFERAGMKVSRCSLEKPYPAVLKKLLVDQKDKIIVFTDFAGRIAPLISELNESKNLVLIVDHHVASPSTDPFVFNLDCELFGIKGSRDMAAATVCYNFAEVMDPVKNKDLSIFALIGAFGDGLIFDGQLVGDNKRVANIAFELNLVEEIVAEPSHSGDVNYRCVEKKFSGMDIQSICEVLDNLGCCGYYEGGPELAVKTLTSCFQAEIIEKANNLRKLQKDLFQKQIDILRSKGLNKTKYIQWFHVGDGFRPMGVKAIGLFLQKIRDLDFVDPKMYLAGIQDLDPDVPGFGNTGMADSKVSMRLPGEMDSLVRKGRYLPLNILMPAATETIGGFSDACHLHAAATMIKPGTEHKLMEEMDKICEGGQGYGVGYGAGKTIFVGGQFLLWQVQAVLGALPYLTVATVEPWKARNEGEKAPECGWTLSDERIEIPGYKKSKFDQQIRSINEELEAMKVDLKTNPIHITLGGDLLAGSGDGASAAGCVSLARAVSQAFGLNLTDDQVNHFGWVGEHGYHGLPSGVDNTCSTFGGVIAFQLDKERNQSWERVQFPKPLHIVLGHSGVSANTSTLYPKTVKLREENPTLFDSNLEKIKGDSALVQKLLKNGEYEKLGKVLIENHALLNSMNISHPRLMELCNLAVENGAYGAKLTGGGMGGYMMALCPDVEKMDHVAQVLRNAGSQVTTAILSP